MERNKLGTVLRTIRESRGLTATGLSECAGISKAMLSRIESCERSPSLETLRSLASALSVSPALLVYAASSDVPRGEGSTAALSTDDLLAELEREVEKLRASLT